MHKGVKFEVLKRNVSGITDINIINGQKNMVTT